MELTGHIHNGVVVFDGGTIPPEGTAVTVLPIPTALHKGPYPPLPVIHGGEPGSLNLTNAMINEILDEEDLRAVMDQWNVPS